MNEMNESINEMNGTRIDFDQFTRYDQPIARANRLLLLTTYNACILLHPFCTISPLASERSDHLGVQ